MTDKKEIQLTTHPGEEGDSMMSSPSFAEGLQDETPQKIEQEVGTEKQEKEEESSELKMEMVPFHFFFKYCTFREKLILMLGYIAAIGAGLLLPSIGIFLGKITVSFDPDSSAQEVARSTRRVCIAIQIFGAILWVLAFCFYSFQQHIAENVVFDLRKRFIRQLLEQEVEYFEKQKVEEIPAQIGDIFEIIQRAIGQNSAMLCFSLFQVVGGFGIAFVFGTKLGALLFLFAPFAFYSLTRIVLRVKESAKAKSKALQQLGGVTEEILSNIKVVISFAREEKELQRFDREALNVMKKSRESDQSTGIAQGASRFTVFGIYVFGFLMGGIFIKEEVHNLYFDRSYTVEMCLAVFFATVKGMLCTLGILPNINAIITARTKAVPVFNVLLRKPKIKDVDDSISEVRLEHGIQFRDIFFRYPLMPQSAPDVLQGVNFTIKAKTSTAIVGPSGAGKSTIVQMIERFYDPKKGEIKVDNVPLKDIKISSLRETIGYVSQEPVLIQGTVRQNMLYGDCVSTEEQIKEALKKANALEFVMQLEKGLDTEVGSSTMLNLSGGQKQRIAIARALLRNPKILILDEATSALDMKSEDEVQRAIDRIQEENKDLTVIVIAHRLSTIQTCQNLVFLQASNNAVSVEKGSQEYKLVIDNLKSEFYANQKENETQETSFSSMSKASSIISLNETLNSGPQFSQEREKQEVQEETKKEKKTIREVSMKEIMAYYDDKKMLALSFVVPVIAASSYPLFGMMFTKLVFVLLLPEKDNYYSQLIENCLLFFLVTSMMPAGTVINKYVFSKGGEKVTYNIRKSVFESILYKHLWWFDNPDNSSGVISNILSEKMAKIHGLTTETISVMIEAFLNLALGVLIASFFSWQIALLALLTTPIMIVGSFGMAKVQFSNPEDNEAYKKSNTLLSEMILNYKTIISFGSKNIDSLMEQYQGYLVMPNKRAIRQAYISGLFFGYSQAAKFGMIGVMFFFGVMLMQKLDLNSRDTFIAIYSVYMGAIGTGFNLAQTQNFKEAKVAAGAVFDIIEEPSELDSRKEGKVKQVQKGIIEFKNVQFSYPNRDQKVLKNLNLKIEEGQSVALVGGSGSGKSTIASMVLQFYKQQEGKVLIDGVPIEDYDIKSLREQIGYVMQEPVLFNDTIKNNVLYGKLDASDQEIQKACLKANALSFIETDIENLDGEQAFLKYQALIRDAIQGLHEDFSIMAEEVLNTQNFAIIIMFLEVIQKGDYQSKEFIMENQELFLHEIGEKVTITGFKWDDFIMRFEWTLKEELPCYQLIDSEPTLSEDVKESMLTIIEANPERLDFDLVQSFILHINSLEYPEQSVDDVIDAFVHHIQEDQKKQADIKMKRFQELTESLSKTFVDQPLHQGFEKSCGLKGQHLSGGQKQRIAIARALIKEPKILILDEATSALDEHSQEIVQQALDRAMQGRTSIVIAHRLSTIRNCNKILVVNEGRIVESGTFRELSEKRNGHFAQLKERMQS